MYFLGKTIDGLLFLQSLSLLQRFWLQKKIYWMVKILDFSDLNYNYNM